MLKSINEWSHTTYLFFFFIVLYVKQTKKKNHKKTVQPKLERKQHKYTPNALTNAFPKLGFGMDDFGDGIVGQ